MPRAVVMEEYGGPEVLRIKDLPIGDPGPGGVRIRHCAIGVNFHDVYVRSGLYRTLALPGIPGIEASAEVIAVGKGVPNVKPGDRVGYVTGRYGAYASERVIDADTLIPLPEAVSHVVAASVLLRGLTVEMLLHRVHTIRENNTVLVQAAAGGVGQILCRWAAQLGAIVIGTVSDDKVELARAAGCHHIVRYRSEDVVKRIMEITQGKGVDVAYDGVGRETFDHSLNALGLCGHLINFGQSSGAVPPFEISALAGKSTTISRPILFHYLAKREVRNQMAANVFDAVSAGWLRVNEPIEFDLSEAAESHRTIEAKGASRPLLLRP